MGHARCKLLSTVKVKVKFTGVQKSSNMASRQIRYAPTASTEANGGFHIVNLCDPLQGATEPEFLIRPRSSVT